MYSGSSYPGYMSGGSPTPSQQPAVISSPAGGSFWGPVVGSHSGNNDLQFPGGLAQGSGQFGYTPAGFPPPSPGFGVGAVPSPIAPSVSSGLPPVTGGYFSNSIGGNAVGGNPIGVSGIPPFNVRCDDDGFKQVR